MAGASLPLLFVFDFDGVVADSTRVMRLAVDRLSARKGVAPPSDTDLRDRSMRELMAHMRIGLWELPWWVWRAKREVLALAHLMRPHAQIRPTLAWAATTGAPLAIASSNSERVIREFLAAHLPVASFAHIAGDLPLFGKHRVLRRLGRKARVVYVGDEVRDIEAAHAAGALSIAVGWGKDSMELLRAAAPTYEAADGTALVSACAAVEAAGGGPQRANRPLF